MRTRLLFVSIGAAFLFITSLLRADQVEMQNGERYLGRVLSVSASIVVMESETLGKINVPRKNVAGLIFGKNPASNATNAIASLSGTNLSAALSSRSAANTNSDLSLAIRNLGANTNVIRQIREQMLAGSPEAAGKYNAMVNGLISGNLNLSDIQREARSSADHLRALKRELGPEADDSLDLYLDILESFLRQTSPSATASPNPQPLTIP